MIWANLLGRSETTKILIWTLIKFMRAWRRLIWMLIKFEKRWPFVIMSHRFLPHLELESFCISKLVPFLVKTKQLYCGDNRTAIDLSVAGNMHPNCTGDKVIGRFGIDCGLLCQPDIQLGNIHRLHSLSEWSLYLAKSLLGACTPIGLWWCKVVFLWNCYPLTILKSTDDKS